MENKIRILYIDKEEHNLKAFYASLRREPKYEIFICQLPEEGMTILQREQIHILIADQLEPFATRMGFIKEMNVKFPEPVKIIVTARRDTSDIESALAKGLIYRYYDKPYKLDALKVTIDEGYNLYQDNLQ